MLKTGAKLTSVEEAIRASQSNIVILAVPKDFYEKQPIHLLEGKVVIDVSNRNSIYAKGESQVFRTIFALCITYFLKFKRTVSNFNGLFALVSDCFQKLSSKRAVSCLLTTCFHEFTNFPESFNRFDRSGSVFL